MSEQALRRVEADDERFESAIIRAARDDSIDIGKLQALLDMQRQVARDASIRMFNVAMASAQAEMLPVIRDATNTHTRSKYARLETIDAQMRPIYTRHGFSVRYGSEPSPREGWMRITCTVAHSGGYWETNYLDAPPDDAGQKGTANKTGIQGVGSSVSYLRRYLLTMSFNIVLADGLDDDGNGGGRTNGNERQDTRVPDPLEELNGTRWLANLTKLVKGAASLDVLVEIGGHRAVRRAKQQAPLLIRQQIEDLFREAHERLAPLPPKDIAPSGDGDQTWDDPVAELIAEVDAMDADGLDVLPGSASWKVKTRDLFPPDLDRVNEAIATRRAVLKGGKAT